MFAIRVMLNACESLCRNAFFLTVHIWWCFFLLCSTVTNCDEHILYNYHHHIYAWIIESIQMNLMQQSFSSFPRSQSVRNIAAAAAAVVAPHEIFCIFVSFIYFAVGCAIKFLSECVRSILPKRYSTTHSTIS